MLQRQALAPSNTVARLFESGILTLEDEAALNELQMIQNAFTRWVSPGKGFLSSGDGNGVPSMPRALGQANVWRRYTRWRQRWNKLVAGPSPSRSTGITAGGLVVALATTELTFDQAAQQLGWRVQSVVALFVRVLRDYPEGAVLVAARPETLEPALEAPESVQEGVCGEGPLP